MRILLLMVAAMATLSCRPTFATELLPGKASASNVYRRIFTPHTFMYTAAKKQQDEPNRACVAFPGGGLFFYWQAGVIVRYAITIKFKCTER